MRKFQFELCKGLGIPWASILEHLHNLMSLRKPYHMNFSSQEFNKTCYSISAFKDINKKTRILHQNKFNSEMNLYIWAVEFTDVVTERISS